MRRHKLFWGSSYDRELDILLFLWPDILKKFPNAELHICYGWETFDKLVSNNPERKAWKKSVQRMMNQKGIFHYGRVGKEKLKKIRKKCGIWAYPTAFSEINCITALDAQHDGLVPVTMRLAALDETVGSGIKLDGNIKDPKVKDKYLKELLDIMNDPKRWKEESQKAKKFAKDMSWEKIAPQWIEEFKKPLKQPKVSVITITIRTGWWNIMADNLSKQTYKNFEWIILDDHEEDRSELAKKYAEKYDLDIKYIRGDKVLGKYKRRYGLVRANNKAWKQANELIVWLQDFILIPENGIESLVDIYRHNPTSLIAPVDVYYHCKKPNQKNKEDWWDGETDIITKKSWTNVRVKNQGIRYTDNAFDFEMNYSATPKRIIEQLNGWWEFFDDGLGYDNTEIALRAIESGHKIIIDDTNIATCIDLWPHIAGKKENIVDRERHLATPYWIWFTEKMKKGELPLRRDEEKDNSIRLEFRVPKEIKDEDCADWISKNAKRIARGWMK